jgi:gas vesicle protein
MFRRPSLALIAGLALISSSCSTAYYSAWEMMGKEKRDLLRSNVESVQKEQEQAAEQFEDALERLRTLYEVDGGELEKTYDELKGDYEDAEKRADDVRDRIDTIDEVANDLFEEWEQEIDEISNASYRSASSQKLSATRAKYAELEASLRHSEASMDPVLTHLKDSVLFLKHNLNAAAIGGLGAEMEAIESDIEQLIVDMRASIAEADSFLQTMSE